MNDLILDERNLKTMMTMAKELSSSNLLPTAYQKNPANLLLVIAMARELQIPPMQAINSLNVISGKVCTSPQLMLALIYSRFPNAVVQVLIDHKEKQVIVRMSRDKQIGVFTESIWNMQRADQMALASKDNWRKQPITMLKWRAVAEAARECFPDVIMGLYTNEEMAPQNVFVDENGALEDQLIQTPPKIKIEAGPLDRLRALVLERMNAGVSEEALVKMLSAIFPIQKLRDLTLVDDESINGMVSVLSDQDVIIGVIDEKSK